MEEKITLSHGSGGKLTYRLIKKIFQKYFDFEELKKNDDGGVFVTKNKRCVITTDSYVVDPIFFPGGNIGTLSISGTINDLASMGAEPLCLSAGFVLEEGLSLKTLEKIVSSMASLLKEEKVPIIAADTKVVEREGSKEPGLFINTTGIGTIFKDLTGLDAIAPEDVIIINGPIGEHGFSVLSSRLGLNKKTPILSDAKPLWSLVKKVLERVDVKFMRDPTRGGLAVTLNEIAKETNLEITLYEEKIPISQKVRGLSELLGIDPLEVANEGKMLFVVEKKVAKEVIQILKTHPDGKNASIIGKIENQHKGKVVVITPYGSKRVLDMPSADQLPRIC